MLSSRMYIFLGAREYEYLQLEVHEPHDHVGVEELPILFRTKYTTSTESEADRSSPT